MRRALVALLALSACTTTPVNEPPDPLAFATPQASVDYPNFAPQFPGMGVTVADPPITAICRNGWVSYSQHRRGTCSGKGGVREWRNRPANRGG